ncbi:MAG TPA: DUF4214 domain-containing protein [Gemmataceae bacterium]|jgi:hypothetical protein
MSRILAFASTALLFVPGLASAQIYYARPAPTGNPGTLVRSGYERYLNRAPGTSGDTWIQAIRNGQTREDFLANLLSSDEYLAEAGGTRPAYVRKLYRDVIGRDPLPAEINYWVGRLRYESPKDIAYVMLRRHPQAESALRAPPPTYDPGYFPDPADPTFRDPSGPYFHSPYFFNYEKSRGISAFMLHSQG